MVTRSMQLLMSLYLSTDEELLCDQLQGQAVGVLGCKLSHFPQRVGLSPTFLQGCCEHNSLPPPPYPISSLQQHPLFQFIYPFNPSISTPGVVSVTWSHKSTEARCQCKHTRCWLWCCHGHYDSLTRVWVCVGDEYWKETWQLSVEGSKVKLLSSTSARSEGWREGGSEGGRKGREGREGKGGKGREGREGREEMEGKGGEGREGGDGRKGRGGKGGRIWREGSMEGGRKGGGREERRREGGKEEGGRKWREAGNRGREEGRCMEGGMAWERDEGCELAACC